MDVISLHNRLKEIARANHPALERKSTVRFVATVGGVASSPVVVDVPGPFMKVADLAGKWDGWPGNDPEDWKFGTGLGPDPQPDSPPKLDVENDLQHKLLEDTRRFVVLCLGAISKPWMEMARDWGMDAFLDKIAGEGTLDAAQQDLAKVFQNSQGGRMITGSFGRLKTWVTGTGGDTFAKSLLDKTMRDTFKELSSGAIDMSVGQRYFKEAKDFVDKVRVHGDPTHRCLTLEAQNKITNLRGDMWEYALLAQTHMSMSGTLNDWVSKGVWAITTWIPASKVSAELGLTVYKGGLNGLNGSVHLYYIVRIVQDYYEIKDIIENPANWKQAAG
jgi:hypothetical protein